MWCSSLFLLFLAAAGIAFAQDVTTWKCTNFNETDIVSNGGIVWMSMNCSSHVGDFFVGPLHFNVLKIDLSRSDLEVVGAIANSSLHVQSLPDIAAQDEALLVGINGGYFFRVDINFTDMVCRGKTRDEALSPVSTGQPNNGIGDSMLIRNGEYLSCNCDKWGYSVPTAVILDGEDSTIDIMTRGGRAAEGVKNAVSGGPNLVSYNATLNQTFVNIPADDDNINIPEHAANTGIGISPGFMYFVTVDGHDGGNVLEPTSGINARQLAYFFKDHLQVQQATAMDQGGSTTMWIKGMPNNGVVSNADTPNVDPSPRPLFAGVFVRQV